MRDKRISVGESAVTRSRCTNPICLGVLTGPLPSLMPPPPLRRTTRKVEINLALADLRYTGNVDASGNDVITIMSSDGYLEGRASSVVRLAWPSGAATRPPTLSFQSPEIEMPEDGSMLLGPVRVRFGDGSSVVQGSVRCSAGAFKLGTDASNGIGGVVILEDGVSAKEVVVRGLPEDVAGTLGEVTYMPPKDWNGRADGVVTLTMEVEATGNAEVRGLEEIGRQFYVGPSLVAEPTVR